MFHLFDPNKHGWVTVLKRIAILIVAMVVSINVIEGMLTTLLLAIMAFVAVTLTLATALPRRIVLWYQYRTWLIEAGFSFAAWHLLGSSKTLGGMTALITFAIVVVVVRITNMESKQRHGRLTVLERVLSDADWSRTLRREAPLPAGWYYDEDKEGFFGFKYLLLGERTWR